MDASILIITGPPGVGKTTASAHVAAAFDPSAVVRADDFFDYLATGFVPPHLPASHAQNVRVIDIAVRAAAGYAAGGWTTVVPKMHAEFMAHELPGHVIDATGNIRGIADAVLQSFDDRALEVG